MKTTLTIPLPRPFELPLALHGHGWIALAPHSWATGSAPWITTLRLGSLLVTVSIQQRERTLAVGLESRRKAGARQLVEATRQLRHMLRLDEDFTAFWQLCRERPAFAWVARRGAGRLLRSATVFEDLMKLLFTTNCSWAATESMTRNLVAAIGTETPGGHRAFPTAAECARDEAFYRDTVRAGYRSQSCVELATTFASGALTDGHFLDRHLSTDELRTRLLALRGFGPYAAGQALRLLGRYDDLAIDSWCRARFVKLLGRRKPPGDKAIAQRYRDFSTFAGLALWCELTADWHGETSESQPANRPSAASAES